MKIFQINICPNQSTGGVMNGIANAVRNNGGYCITASPPKDAAYPPDHFVIGSTIERKVNILLGKIINTEYKLNFLSTIRLIRKIYVEKPDIIHFHNLHAYYLNIPLLFWFIKKEKYPVVWTFHDCWPITGHCTHFLMSGCDKWKTECNNCKQFRLYPGGWRDKSRKKYLEKKKIFSSIERLIVVTPSKWLAEIVKQSFLQNNDAIVINNGIDLSIFSYRRSNFLKKNCLDGKFVILGVASQWEKRKGVDIFNRLASDLNDDFRIVLVGSFENCKYDIDNKILKIGKTENPYKLAEVYSSATIFVNPTREDTFPTVNIEALACGTPVITFKTGGSPEIIDEHCGAVVQYDDYDALKFNIEEACYKRKYDSEACRKRALQYDKTEKFTEYIRLYKTILNNN